MKRLPEPYARLLPLLSAPRWRERKEAVVKLREAVADDRDRPEVLHPLAETLVDGLLAPDGLEGRAACHEVLVAMGPHSSAAVMARVEASEVPPRLLIDLLGELGDRVAVPQCAALLRDDRVDPNLRASAASALGRLGGAEAVAALRTTLLDALRGLDHPDVRAIGEQKLAWVRTHLDQSLPEDRFACIESASKALYVSRSPGVAILIDDRSSNIAKWHEAGGLGVQHTSASESIATLARLLDAL